MTTGLALEVAQVGLRLGIFDVDDIILNAFGVVVGYWMFLELAERAPPAAPLSARSAIASPRVQAVRSADLQKSDSDARCTTSVTGTTGGA